MANSNTPYTREGDINAWNDLIRKINLQAEECNLVPLEEVDENHILAKSDIRDAQDKLIEACIDNVFSPIPDRWLVDTIQQLEDIAASDPCCCEEDDIIFPDFDFIGIIAGPPGDPTVGFKPTQVAAATFDWAAWIMQETEPLVITPVDCGEDTPVETRTGGRGWVGTDFRRWEMFAFSPTDPDTSHQDTPIANGNVVNGYIQIGEGSPKLLNQCGEPENSGTPLGENDPEWTFPYDLENIPGSDPSQRRIFSLNNSFTINIPITSMVEHGLLPIGVPTAPTTIEFHIPFSGTQAFLRVKC